MMILTWAPRQPKRYGGSRESSYQTQLEARGFGWFRAWGLRSILGFRITAPATLSPTP